MRYVLSDILEMTGWSRSTLWRKRDELNFPEPINPDAKPLQWRRHQVDFWLRENQDDVLSDRDRLIIEKFSDEYEQARDEIRDNIVEDDFREPYEEAYQEARDEAIEVAWQAEREEWLRGAVIEADDDKDEDDIQSLARDLFDENLKADGHRRAEIVNGVGTSDLDALVQGDIDLYVQTEALKSVKEDLAKQRKQASA